MRKLFLTLSAIFFLLMNVFSQNRSITGKINDDQGNPLPNVSVTVKNSSLGTTTGTDGSFQLSIPSNARTLTISYVGYQPKDVTIGNQDAITVSLNSSDRLLEEVVVNVPYGTVRKEALTGSVGVITAAEIGKRPINNITNAIEGAIPGVVTSSTNGQPGSGLTIRVRGFGSFSASSDPLFVVDGIPYVGGISNINPADVESITVLKDAASTALYGSRAANGVVIVTTKKGQKGKNNVSVRVMQGRVQRGLQEYDRLDAFQYYPIMWEAYRNSLVYPASGTGITRDAANQIASGLVAGRTGIKDLLGYNPFNVPANSIVGVDGKINPNAQLLYGDDLDWTRDLLRVGNRSDYNINFNGGSDKSDYYLSLGYANEQGFTIRSDLKRYSARLNVNVQPKTWLKNGLNISGNYSVSNTASDGGSTNFVNPFFFSRNIGPIYPVYAHNMTTGEFVLDAKGNKIWDLGNFGSSPLGIQNGISNRPSGGFGGRMTLAETILNESIFRRSFAAARNTTEISFLKNFKLSNNIGIDLQTQQDNSYENTLVGDGAPGGRSRRGTSTSTNLVLYQLLSYNKRFGDHNIDAFIGHETTTRNEYDVNGFKQGQSLTGNTELGNFTTINSTGSSRDQYRIEGFFSNARYNYKGRYDLSASIRRDGNSRFAPESRHGTFWSVGAGWNLAKENFLNTAGWIDLLRLRTNYGTSGNAEGIGFYAYQGLYGFANNANQPGIIQSQTAFENRKLTWENLNQFDIALDFGLFKNRLTGKIDYYNKINADLLFAVPTPLSSGALSTNQNTATISNKGVDIELNGDIVRRKDVRVNLNVNLSTVKNRITKMPETVPEFISGTKRFAVGQSIFDYWLRTYYGVDPSDGAALYIAENTAVSATRRLITNKDGGVDTVTTSQSNGKFAYHGTAIPDLYGSLTPSVTFKGVTLSALFTFQKDGKTYDANYQGLMSSGTYGGALHIDILNRWQNPGDITNTPRMDNGRTVDFNAASSRWLIDASYINIRSLNLSYVLPESIISRLRIANGQFFVSAENVAFFSKRKGLNNQQAFSGVTSNAYPPARVLSAGLNLNL
ncbi:MAG: SusC/RagA family TonB-linked outer membrane protein [Chitinophagaceae bacterium]